jgi:pyruvate formate lyase activating enzyme
MTAVVECQLCPKLCRIAPGQSGECRVRVNRDGRLLAVVYGHPCAVHVDPIEKKPLFHFHPGSTILSLATVGCNLHCLNCQNWEISQANPEDQEHYAVPPEEVAALAAREGCRSVAYTYTDPSVYFEYALDASAAVRARGGKNVLVTAGYLNPEPARRLLAVTDAANVDLKFIRDEPYVRVCDAHLAPIQTYIRLAAEAGVWTEITHLVIPTLNDAEEDLRALARWVRDTVGPDVPLHVSRFTPRYKLTNLPPTPAETVERARVWAKEEGLRHVYVGNLRGADGEDTLCPGCGATVVARRGYRVLANRLRQGRCPDCGAAIAGVWDDATIPPERPQRRAAADGGAP